ncbi:AroB-related putative sugar phosphate phospholyase (cyclizing) [Joostella sp. CR20]|uniref:AroB-related putative sugar phosphate phospholyase (cyclizing) n=1 Tax=Joostella sp. CR20 TaxID=2804312 RepID=UPI00313C3B09
MEDIQIFDFEIKSKVHNYSVYFKENIKESLLAEVEEGDFFIIDSNIRKLYGEIFNDFLLKYNFYEVEANEGIKSYKGIIPLIDTLIRNGFKKNNKLFSIGGGITQDVTSFISSVLYRGVKWVFIPTSLLAQGDSCIGSKTSINFDEFKNQIGGFYPPNKIFIDVNFLKSLPKADFNSGLGELCHYIILSSKRDFDMVKESYDLVINDRKKLKEIIYTSLNIKKGYIEEDEYDTGIRQLLNYGHSFGHAIESITNYKIPHGIAVAIGMDMANYVSVQYGLLDLSTRNYIKEFLKKIWYGYSLENITVQTLLHALSKDKKNVGVNLGLILLLDFGKAEKKIIPPDENLVNYLENYLNEEL